MTGRYSLDADCLKLDYFDARWQRLKLKGERTNECVGNAWDALPSQVLDAASADAFEASLAKL